MRATMLLAPGNRIVRAVFVLLAGIHFSCAREPSPKEIPIADFIGTLEALSIKGDKVEAKTWMEAGDSNVLLISKIQKGEPCEKEYADSLFAYRLIKVSGKWSKVWEIKDFGPGPCKKIRFQKGTIRVFDIDGEGQSETLFFYSIAQDGAAPATLKMMFHLNGAKRPIRGKIPLTPDDSDAYEFQLDSLLLTAPKAIQAFALNYWNQYVSRKYGDLIPNSPMDKTP